MLRASPNFNKIKSELKAIFSKAEFELEGAHSTDTLKWVKKIDANASESLQIAALSHDIDRAVGQRIKREEKETYDDYKKRHAKRSSQLITELMTKYGYPKDMIKKTSLLVENHEVGGDKETNILMDADSVSFFSCNIEWYFRYKGREGTKDKIIFMYKRATPRAKQMIKTIKIKNEILRKMCNDIFSGCSKK
jgi:hypothetical protein